jgi:hypothetical protein
MPEVLDYSTCFHKPQFMTILKVSIYIFNLHFQFVFQLLKMVSIEHFYCIWGIMYTVFSTKFGVDCGGFW